MITKPINIISACKICFRQQPLATCKKLEKNQIGTRNKDLMITEKIKIDLVYLDALKLCSSKSTFLHFVFIKLPATS